MTVFEELEKWLSEDAVNRFVSDVHRFPDGYGYGVLLRDFGVERGKWYGDGDTVEAALKDALKQHGDFIRDNKSS